MTPVAPRIVNNISSVTCIHHGRSILCGRRMVFGDVAVSLFVAGAVFGEMWNDRRSATYCNFSIQNARGGREK